MTRSGRARPNRRAAVACISTLILVGACATRALPVATTGPPRVEILDSLRTNSVEPRTNLAAFQLEGFSGDHAPQSFLGFSVTVTPLERSCVDGLDSHDGKSILINVRGAEHPDAIKPVLSVTSPVRADGGSTGTVPLELTGLEEGQPVGDQTGAFKRRVWDFSQGPAVAIAPGTIRGWITIAITEPQLRDWCPLQFSGLGYYSNGEAPRVPFTIDLIDLVE